MSLSIHPALSNQSDARCATLIRHLGSDPPLVDMAKWNKFKSQAVPLFVDFLEEHPDQVVCIGACDENEFDTGHRMRPSMVYHPVRREYIDVNIYNREAFGTVKDYVALFRTDGDTLNVCESHLCVAHRETAEVGQSVAQKAQFHAGKKAGVLYAVAGLRRLEFIMFSYIQREQKNLRNEIVWLRNNKKDTLDGYSPQVQLGNDSDLCTQAAAHIVVVARRTNTHLDDLFKLFVFPTNFGKKAENTLKNMSEAFKKGWKEVFTGKNDRIGEKKYVNVREKIMPMLIFEKTNMNRAALPPTSGSLSFLSTSSTSLAGAPAASAVPAAAPKRQAPEHTFEIFTSLDAAKKQKSAGTNPHELAAAAAARSSSAGAGAGAGADAGAGTSAGDAISIE